MIRYIAVALLLTPGIAHAQKFVSVTGDPLPEAEASATSLVPEGAELVDDTFVLETVPTDDGATLNDPSQVADISGGTNLVLDGASAEEIQTLLNGATSGAESADAANAIVARVETGADGQSVLMLDTAESSDASNNTSGDSASLELGECNEGTNWVAPEINCYNAYPASDG